MKNTTSKLKKPMAQNRSVMRCFPSIKQRCDEMDKVIKNYKYSMESEVDFRQGFMTGYNWAKRELRKNIA